MALILSSFLFNFLQFFSGIHELTKRLQPRDCSLFTMSLEHDPYTSLTEFGSLSFIIFVQFRPVIPVQKLLIRRCTGDAVNISVTVLVDVIASERAWEILASEACF